MSEQENAPAETAAAETVATESAATETAAAETAAAETAATETTAAESAPESTEPPAPAEEITYHAVERDGQVTAIWEMQGRKHLRTIDPRSRQGQEILRLYTSDHHDETPATAEPETSEAAST
jgi:hypothetical protein